MGPQYMDHPTLWDGSRYRTRRDLLVFDQVGWTRTVTRSLGAPCINRLRGTVNSAFGNAHIRFAVPFAITTLLLHDITVRVHQVRERMLVEVMHSVNGSGEGARSLQGQY